MGANVANGNEVVLVLLGSMIIQIMLGLLIGYIWYRRVSQRKIGEVGDDMDEESPPSLFRGKILPAVKKGLKTFATLWYEGARMMPMIWPPW